MSDDNKILHFSPKTPTGGGVGGRFGGLMPTDHGFAESCPVQAVGTNAGVYFYMTPSGQLRRLAARDHNANQIYSLFETWSGFLGDKWPKKSRDDNAPGWDHKSVGFFLMDQGARAGLVDITKSLRGVGVWRQDNGELIVHCGDQIRVGRTWDSAGKKIDGKFYIAMPAVDRPADQAAEACEIENLFRFLRDSYAWQNPEIDARFLLGWIGCGVLAGALDWRPHIWLTAPQGAGKSKLDDLIQALLGDSSDKVSDPTAAGVRGLLGVSARGILADEVEPGDNKRAESMIELARMGSTDSQGAVIRGTSDGGVQQWPIRASFLFSSILVPAFRPQDYGRITVLEMSPLPTTLTAEEIRDFEAMRSDFKALGPRLRARVINGYSRFRANIQTYSAIMAADGHARRAADQLATMLAMADMMLTDVKVTDSEAAAVLSGVSVAALVGGDEVGDDIECIQHLFSTRVVVRFNDGNQNFTIGELIEACPPERNNWRQKELRRLGLAVNAENGFDVLHVSTSHQQLLRIFRDTRWRAGGHTRVLRRLPAFAPSDNKTISFSGYKSKSVKLLISQLPIDFKPVDDTVTDPI